MPQRTWSRASWLVVLLTLLAAALVLAELQRPSYWIDEKISVDAATGDTPQQIITNVIGVERRPPGYHLGLWVWLELAGSAERTARATLAISEATKNDLVRFFRVDPQRITVTPLAAAAHFRPPSRAEIDRVRQQRALPDRYMLYFGSNKPHKNVPRLVEAFAASSARANGIDLVIAGQWDERYPQAKELVERPNLKDRVRFIGPVKDHDLPALYGGAQLFVFPSEYEGFGLPIMEAMACGAPVVCGNRSSLPEVAGDAALLCDPLDAVDITLALNRVMDDAALRFTLQQRALERAAQFTWERTAQLTRHVYKRVLAG